MKRQNKNACLKSTRPLPRLRVVVFFGDSLTFGIIFLAEEGRLCLIFTINS